MIAGSLARRYARAVLEIGVEQGNLDKLGTEIGTLAEAMQTVPELSEALSNPAFPRAERKKILEAVLKRIMAGKITTNFTYLLLDRDRLSTLPDISRELSRMIDDRAGRVNASVTSAKPLSPMQVRQLQAALEKLSGKQVKLQTTEDPALLGGLVARVGDLEYDGSLKSQIERLRAGLS
jgi:F-type H+-transporting ATPase subunit delta